MRVALLGLGQMGGAIAERLQLADHELWVWNRSAGAAAPFVARGAHALERPADAWAHAELVITMLADDAAVEDVVLGAEGLLAGACTGAIVDMSTISAAASARVAAACAERSCAFLRAPVSGNPSVVRAGRLSIIVSGEQSHFDCLDPVLRDIGPTLFYVGGGEKARIVKLALNLMIAGTIELIAEALVLAEKSGIGRAEMLDVMGRSVVGSPLVSYKTQALIADDYTTTFSTRLMDKDLSLVLDAAREAEVPLPLAALVQQLFRGAIAMGLGDQDFTALLPRLRRESGLAS